MNKSETIGKLAAALVQANAEITTITKDANNPHFKSTYASLANIIESVRPILSKHKVSVLQFPSGDGETLSLTTMLLHESGEFIESPAITMKPSKVDPQGIGSATTYARRYSLSAVLNLGTDEDDDGNAASQPSKQSQRSESKKEQPKKLAAEIKTKWAILNGGDLGGLDEWKAAQAKKGWTEQNMVEALTKKIMDKKAEEKNADPAPDLRQESNQNVSTANSKKKVLDLRTERNMPYDELAEMASLLLGRQIKKVMSDIKTNDEWARVYEAMTNDDPFAGAGQLLDVGGKFPFEN